MTSVRNRLIAGAATAAAVVAGLGVTATSAHAASARPVTSVTVGPTGYIHAPTNLHPGRAQFVIQGTGSGGGAHAIELARPIDSSQSGKARLIYGVKQLNSTGKALDLEAHFYALGGSDNGTAFWSELRPGKYFLFDTDHLSTLAPSHVHTIFVSGSSRDATLPVIHPTVSAVGEMSWATMPTSIPRVGGLHFVNTSTDWHFLELAQLQPGKTDADVVKAFQGKESFNKVFTGVFYDTGTVSPGHEMTASYSLPKGGYDLLCFWPDDETGQPHAFMGMHRGITLT